MLYKTKKSYKYRTFMSLKKYKYLYDKYLFIE